MSTSEDDGAVLVEHSDVPDLVNESATTTKTHGDEKKTTNVPEEKEETSDEPQALNVVSIGSEADSYAFTFNQAKLDQILNRIPAGVKVSVVSVVGAFRTGKSFLLSWFLRYLHHLQQTEIPTEEDSKPWYRAFDSVGQEGFHWKAGTERDTTGIWIWSHPHIIERKDGSKVAVLLVDTQGLFDHETTMSLTASIFGFSTLLTSYQIYNVDKRIQEDNLQHLALFAEYAKTAVASDVNKKDESDEALKPFQRMEFLVRDWQHFGDDEDDEDADGNYNYLAMEKSMEKYLQTVIAERSAKDLKDTREQIVSCFEEISCYGLCHPGFAVTKKKYKGDVSEIEDLFLHMLDRYCSRVFANAQPKKIHGHELNAAEFGAYVAAYAQLFQSGAKFPEAATLLEATATTNNTNAIQLALNIYQEEMDRVAGPNCTDYLSSEEFDKESIRLRGKSLEAFSSVANFGSKSSIAESRRNLMSKLDEKVAVYSSLNESRDPLRGMET